MKNYTTYIFDLDGTITDTLTVWLGIYRDGLLAFGVTPPDDQRLSQHTHAWKELLKLGLPEDKLDDFIALAIKMANERLPEAPLHGGAYEALEALKNHGKKLAVFSTMDRPILEPVMEHRNLNSIMSVAIAGTDVAHRKPHPAGLLKAIEDLGIETKDYDKVVYIGDKDTDIETANNAGIDGVLYYPAAHQLFYDLDKFKQQNPVHILTDWQQLIDSLEK